MWLVVGLGNPGPTHRHNRHNVGFRVVDSLAIAAHGRWRTTPVGVVSQIRHADEAVHLLKPHTYMNRSGEVVAPLAARLDVPARRIIILHDDVDLPLGTVRLKEGGGHGGHNGLRSVIAELGDRGFLRVRMGIGRPEAGDVVAWVLGDFPSEQASAMRDTVSRAGEATAAVLRDGLAKAASTFNARQRGA